VQGAQHALAQEREYTHEARRDADHMTHQSQALQRDHAKALESAAANLQEETRARQQAETTLDTEMKVAKKRIEQVKP